MRLVRAYTPPTASAWTSFSFTFTPSSCSSSTMTLTVGLPINQNSAGTVWFDDLSVKAGGFNLLADPGFEVVSEASWGNSLGTRPTYVNAHDGAAAMRLNPSSQTSQSITGWRPTLPTSSAPGAWFPARAASATLAAGSGGTPGTSASGSWALVQASGTSDASGILLITLSAGSATGTVVYWDDVTFAPPAVPIPAWGQSFGYL